MILIVCVPSHATTLNVDPDGNGEYPTIAAALAAAVPGDIVELACGTYYEHDLELPDGVTLRSASLSPSCAVIDAQAQGRVILGGDDVTLHGLTVQNGYLAPSPWHNDGGGAKLGNRAQVLNCNFLDNLVLGRDSCLMGGCGLFARDDALLVSCLFEGNDGCHPTGAQLHRNAVLSGCRFVHDTVDVSGDAEGAVSANLCRFESSDLIISAERLTLDQCLFDGCAIGSYELPWATITRCTMNGFGWVAYGSVTTMVMSKTVSVNSNWNHSSDWLDIPVLNCNNFHDCHLNSDFMEHIGQNDNFSVDPQFCGAPDGNFLLQSDSPCLPANSPCGSLVGAFPEGCGTTSTEARSWSSIKALY